MHRDMRLPRSEGGGKREQRILITREDDEKAVSTNMKSGRRRN